MAPTAGCAAFCSTARPVWATPEKHAGPIRGLAVGADRIASAGEDGVVRLWTFAGTPAGTLDAGGGMVLAVAFAPNGDRLVAETADTRLRMWRRDGANGVYNPAVMFRDVDKRYAKLLPNLIHYDVGWGWDRSLAFAPDGSAFAAADFGGAVQRWSLTGTPIGDPLPSQGKQHIRAIAVAPDGRLAAAVYDGTVADLARQRRRAGGIQGRRGHHHRRRVRARRQATRHRRHRRRGESVEPRRHTRRRPAGGPGRGRRTARDGALEMRARHPRSRHDCTHAGARNAVGWERGRLAASLARSGRHMFRLAICIGSPCRPRP